MQELNKPRNIFSVFAASQETFEEAKKKQSEESSKRATYFRFAKDGTYNVRILPLAPVQDSEGNFLPLERKGYEYPLRSYMLKIEDSKKLVGGKPSVSYVNVCNAQYAFKGLEKDLLDVYKEVACTKYVDDENLVKKLNSNGFSGGLKWESRRCMYAIDLDNPSEGFQVLQLSYAQYKDLEERKINLWGKLCKNGKTDKNGNPISCPISSPDCAYPIEITRKTEGGKPAYSFNIDTVSGTSPLDEETLEKLLDTPRIPELIYRYTRYHLEATIVFLTQLDEKYDIDVMNSEEVQNCIAQIKMLLPADDTSHFTIGGRKESDDSKEGANTIDSLWDRYDALDKAGLDDQTDEGQALRSDIMAYIDANDLDVKITRKKTNYDILEEIEDELSGEDEEDKKPSPKPAPKPVEEPEEEDDDEPASVPELEEEDEEEEAPAPRRRERNDDTNEPAARSRRAGRPVRRR